MQARSPPQEPERCATDGTHLTEFGNGPMMPTLVPKVRGKPIEDRRVIVMALMQAAASDQSIEQLLTADEVAERLRVSRDWVWDHSSRRLPYLPVIRMSDGALRYRSSEIEEFLEERARAAQLRRRR